MQYREGEREVPVFARAMQARLDEHADRPGWNDEDPEWLMDRMKEKVVDLDALLSPIAGKVPWAVLDEEEKALILKKAADASNFAMMIADRCGALFLQVQRDAQEW